VNIRYVPIPDGHTRLYCGHGEEEDCATPAKYYVLARIDGVWMWDATCVCSSEECAALRLSQFHMDCMQPWDGACEGKP
jgi:hypothetical protein